MFQFEEAFVMKKITAILLAALLMLAGLTACGGGSAGNDEQSEADTTASLNVVTTIFPVYDWIRNIAGTDNTDADISKLSSTMVYSVVYDMVTRPNEYIGKKIRMSGTMSTYHDEETGVTYYACLIADATACCAQGIEFQTTDEFDPSEYPAVGEPVTVLGTYDLYEENGVQYCVLKDAVLE